MKLAIVGSTNWPDAGGIRVAKMVICAAITFLEPDGVISGGAWGVDSWVREEMEARNRAVDFSEYLPAVRNWTGLGGFKDRNMKVARFCDQLVCIRSIASKTYGSGWTADFAEKELGKKVWRITI